MQTEIWRTFAAGQKYLRWFTEISRGQIGRTKHFAEQQQGSAQVIEGVTLSVLITLTATVHHFRSCVHNEDQDNHYRIYTRHSFLNILFHKC